MNTDSSIREIKGIGDKTEAAFSAAGVRTVSDLLCFYPRTFERFEKPITVREARYRDYAAVFGVIVKAPVTRYVKKLSITEVVMRDPEGSLMKASWFHMPYLSKTLKTGTGYVFVGRLNGFGPQRSMTQPKLYKGDVYDEMIRTIRPVYSLPKSIPEKVFRNALLSVMRQDVFPAETLSAELLRDFDLIPIKEAVREIHFPSSPESFQTARRRLVFEEFYRFLYKIREMKKTVELKENRFTIAPKKEVDDLIERLPYALTNAQKKTLSEIRRDLSGPSVTNRLIQGDVGSGKTILCFLAMLETALNGYESVLMVPTEVLAKQHYETFTKLSETYGLGLSISLLTGSMTAAEKKRVYEQISTHTTDMVIGTHAVIQKKPDYEDLGLVITDEQHRFGVRQREKLKEKGTDPHMIVLSATPIPRTLAMILYGDMDISVIDEMPKNRLPIKTAVVDIEYRPNAYRFIQKQIEQGHQSYVICPLVEESEGYDGENVVEYTKKLSVALGGKVRVGTLHGRMKPEEKEAIMTAFAKNEIQVLVSTTVIEVGIDVSNATVILIENAERFGLAQLHQLRGRVGRGQSQSYCILVDTTGSEESRKRLNVLGQSTDGFFIASEDLKLRGPGDFFGIRQSGDVTFRLADIYQDSDLLKLAEQAVTITKSGETALKTPVL